MILPFHRWKDEKIKELGGFGSSVAARPKEWFWSEYGRYCKKERQKK